MDNSGAAKRHAIRGHGIDGGACESRYAAYAFII